MQEPSAELEDDVPADEAVTAEVSLDEPAEQLPLDTVPARPAVEYRLPSPGILKRSKAGGGRGQDHQRLSRQLVETLSNFGIEARVIGMVSGPRVTRYELQLAPGIKVNRVSQLRDDLAYALATTEIRILAPIPGKQAVGVEVPNLSPTMVTLGDIYDEPGSGSSPLTAWLGKDIAGHGVACDLAKMPHLLIAGTTGAGKSGCINALLSSILLRATPEDVRMILVDPKRVELNHYEAIPHLLTPVVTNMKNAALVLQNVVREMESRYELMGASKTRNLIEWNRVREAEGRERIPYMLVVIDELADLMMVSPADVEDAIIRLAQKSRAVGIHLVLATQSPRVDVITGMIKANVPSRIAFAVSSQTDSRVILDVNGAEALLGQGDMLYKPLGTSKMQRVQGAYITEDEIRRIVDACRKQGEPTFEEELLETPHDVESEQLDRDEDPVLEDAIRLVAQHQTASVSLLQRRLRVGYTRAGRLIDMLERRGIVSGYEGSKARNVLIAESDLPRILGDGLEERAVERRRAVRRSDLLGPEPPPGTLRAGEPGLVRPAAGERRDGHAGAVQPRRRRRISAGHPGAALADRDRLPVGRPAGVRPGGRAHATATPRASRCIPAGSTRRRPCSPSSSWTACRSRSPPSPITSTSGWRRRPSASRGCSTSRATRRGPGWRRPSPAARTGWTPRCCRPTCRGRRSRRSRPRTRR